MSCPALERAPCDSSWKHASSVEPQGQGGCGQGPCGLPSSDGLPSPFPSLDGLVGMAIVGGMALGVAGLAGLIGLAVSKSKS